MNGGTTLSAVAQVTQPLSDISRFSRDFCLKDESVLEHTGFVVLYCLALSERLVAAGCSVDQQKLLRRAALHDIDEAGTGDINRTAKHSSPEAKAALDKFASEFVKVYCIAFGGAEAFKDWQQDKADDIEGQIIRAADLAAVVQKVDLELNRLGNKNFEKVAKELRHYIAEAISKVDHPLLSDELCSFYSVLPDRGEGGLL